MGLRDLWYGMRAKSRRRNHVSPSAGIESLEPRLVLTDTIPNDTFLTAQLLPAADSPSQDVWVNDVVDSLSLNPLPQDTQDFFKFLAGNRDANVRGKIQIDLTGLSADLRIRVYNSHGVEIKGTVNNPGTQDETFTFTVTSRKVETYAVQVCAGTPGAVSSYELTVTWFDGATPFPLVKSHENADTYANDSTGAPGYIEDLKSVQSTFVYVQGRMDSTDPSNDYYQIFTTTTTARPVSVILKWTSVKPLTEKKLDVQLIQIVKGKDSIMSPASVAVNSTTRSLSFKINPNTYYFLRVYPKTTKDLTNYTLGIRMS